MLTHSERPVTPPRRRSGRPARSLPWFFAVVGLVLLSPVGSAGQDTPPPTTPAQPAEGQRPRLVPTEKRGGKQPVILLTGFEPFGERKPPNPSWEAVKRLDGGEWRGYRLVGKQLPVVWGAPLPHLETWIKEFEPVAVFSFGQGAAGSFALETRASNERGGFRGRPVLDNLGQRAAAQAIVGNGPEQLEASIKVQGMVRGLAEKGYPIRVSREAGRYLCEECLYSLEFLKGTKHRDLTVSFCHVPPLGSSLLGNPVTVQYVRQFVLDFLETWHAAYQKEPAAAPHAGEEPSEAADAKDARIAEVREFVGRYFRTWSNQDMKGYEECFLPDASIQFIDPRGQVETSSRRQFVAGQREYHRTAAHRATEVPETIDVHFEAKLARVLVYWKLTAGPRTEYGYDHFTLMKHEGSWRIVNLVFYPVSRKIAN